MTDDERLAVEVAQAAVAALLELRTAGVLSGPPLKDAGDARGQELISAALAAARPDDVVLSEEAADDRRRLSADRVWIVDPLDGTREFAELRDDWAVHVALWVRGTGLVAAAVASANALHSTGTPAVRAAADGRIRLAVSRTRPAPLVHALVDRLGAEAVPMGSAGVKAMAVVDGTVDAYVHDGGQYEWDSAAPVAVARAAGLHTSRLDGSPLVYNRSDPWLPDLVVCRPELAGRVLGAIAEERGAG